MALTTPTLQNLAVEWGVRDNPAIIVDLVKSSGILQTALVAPSNYGNKHRYKLFNSLPAAAFRAFGTGIVPSEISKDRMSIDLWDLSALAQEDAQEILNHPGGKAGWVAANLGAFLESMGQAASKQIIYGTDTTFGGTSGFLGLHQYAKANSNVIAQLSGTTGSRTSIFAVRWDETNGASIRVGGSTSANLISVEEVNEGKPHLAVTSTTTMAQLPVFSWWLHAYMTLVIPSKKSVAAITQVDASHAPTFKQLNDMVDAVEASSGRLAIYTSKLGRSQIASLKDAKMNLFNETMDYGQYLATWRGVPIIVDENILTTETTVLD